MCRHIYRRRKRKWNTVTKYINEDGLKGKYSIYIEIDGTLYNTEKYVEF